MPELAPTARTRAAATSPPGHARRRCPACATSACCPACAAEVLLSSECTSRRMSALACRRRVQYRDARMAAARWRKLKRLCGGRSQQRWHSPTHTAGFCAIVPAIHNAKLGVACQRSHVLVDRGGAPTIRPLPAPRPGFARASLRASPCFLCSGAGSGSRCTDRLRTFWTCRADLARRDARDGNNWRYCSPSGRFGPPSGRFGPPIARFGPPIARLVLGARCPLDARCLLFDGGLGVRDASSAAPSPLFSGRWRRTLPAARHADTGAPNGFHIHTPSRTMTSSLANVARRRIPI